MKVIPINYYNYCSKQNDRHTKTVNSKGLGSMLIGAVAREGISAVKSRKSVNYLYDLKNYINSSNLEEFIAGTKALTKTPDAFYDYDHSERILWVSSFMGKDLTHVDELRKRCLANLSRIPDCNPYNIQAKKDLISSLFENGHEISKTLLESFSELRDSLYQSFKEDTVDKAFYSTRYNQARSKNVWYIWGFRHEDTTLPNEYTWSCKPFSLDERRGKAEYSDCKKEICSLTYAFDNLKLASTLDRSRYRSYLSKNRAAIERYKQMLENYFQRCRSCGQGVPPNTYNEYENILKLI